MGTKGFGGKEGSCGSCSTGKKEAWEAGDPAGGGEEGVLNAEAEAIRNKVAQDIQEMQRSQDRGTVPGHWARWADARLNAKVPWGQLLRSVVRRSIYDVAGKMDFSYARPSRRQAACPQVIFPAMRAKLPQVAVVIDTSGSMGDDLLAQALAETGGVLKSFGASVALNVISVDAAIQNVQKVFDAHKIQLAGGGGTDMGVGIHYAEKIRPRPQVCIVLTDMYTPWPDCGPDNMKVIIAALGGQNGQWQAPAWARVVDVVV
jgi:predicted metal-dependent peptidase